MVRETGRLTVPLSIIEPAVHLSLSAWYPGRPTTVDDLGRHRARVYTESASTPSANAPQTRLSNSSLAIR